MPGNMREGYGMYELLLRLISIPMRLNPREGYGMYALVDISCSLMKISLNPREGYGMYGEKNVIEVGTGCLNPREGYGMYGQKYPTQASRDDVF